MTTLQPTEMRCKMGAIRHKGKVTGFANIPAALRQHPHAKMFRLGKLFLRYKAELLPHDPTKKNQRFSTAKHKQVVDACLRHMTIIGRYGLNGRRDIVLPLATICHYAASIAQEK